jgi:hypothetical protein
MAGKIQKTFEKLEEIWAAVPSYVKVFIYSSTSSIAGLYLADALETKAVVLIVLTNLGLYTVPRNISELIIKQEPE